MSRWPKSSCHQGSSEVIEMADRKVGLNDVSAKEAKAKDAALEGAVSGIRKEFGEGSLMRLGDKGTVKVEAIPTGSLALDLALGIGGVPRGRIVEIFGPESSGKSTLAMHVVAEAQRNGGICAYTFHTDGRVEVESLELEPGMLRCLRDRLLLFYTGAARSASKVLADQDRRSQAGDRQMLENLHRTKELGLRSRELLRAGDLEGYAELMHEHWEHKRGRSPGMTAEHIDRLYALARRSGAIGGKLVGAGGGGFLLVYARRPEETRQAMAAAGAPELAFDFEFGGAYASEYA